MPPVFNEEKCLKCGNCVARCPGYILTMSDKGPQVAVPDECWHCGCCRVACPVEAVDFVFPLHTRL